MKKGLFFLISAVVLISLVVFSGNGLSQGINKTIRQGIKVERTSPRSATTTFSGDAVKGKKCQCEDALPVSGMVCNSCTKYTTGHCTCHFTLPDD